MKGFTFEGIKYEGISSDSLKIHCSLTLKFAFLCSSLKTSENLEVVKSLPLESLQLETDAPWCEIRATHASATFLGKGVGTFAPQEYITVKKPDKWVTNCIVKGRNEPMFIK